MYSALRCYISLIFICCFFCEISAFAEKIHDERLNVFGQRIEPSITLPSGYKTSKKYPVIILIHGYNNTGARNDLYLGVSRQASKYGYIAVVPNATPESENGPLRWNVAWSGSNGRADDLNYISTLIDVVREKYSVDEKKFYLIGHSNGGFFANFFACRRAQKIAGIVNFAGLSPTDTNLCQPQKPVSILHVHGTADDNVPYNGTGQYASAEDSTLDWSRRNHCQYGPKYNSFFDLVSFVQVPGAETQPIDWTGCEDGTTVSLWKMNGAGHSPFFGLNDRLTQYAVEWLFRIN